MLAVICERTLHLGAFAAREYPAINRNSSYRRDARSCIGMDGERNDERVFKGAQGR